MSDVACPSCGEEGSWSDFQDSEETAPDAAQDVRVAPGQPRVGEGRDRCDARPDLRDAR